MRLTGSGVTRPVGVPKMPPGLVELMEGLTRDVLKHNPADVYEFCANHMRKLLEIRDGCAPDKPLTLEQKIARAQQKIRRKAEERRKKYDMEMKLLCDESGKMNVQEIESPTETIIDNSLTTQTDHETDLTEVKKIENPSITITENTYKAPIHHEKDLVDALEVEIFHKATNVVKDLKNNEAAEINKAVVNNAEIFDTSNKLLDNNDDYTKSDTAHEESKSGDIHLNFHENDVLVENESANTLQNVSDTIEIMDQNKSNTVDDMLINDDAKSPDHIRKPRSIDATEESFAESVDVGHMNEQIMSKNDEVSNAINENVDEAEKSAEETVYKYISDTSKELAGDIGENIEENVNNIGDVAVNGKTVEMLESTEGPVVNIVEANEEMADMTVEENLDNVECTIEDNVKEISKDVVKAREENFDRDNITIIDEKVNKTLEKLEKVDNIAKVASETAENLSNFSEVNADIISDAVNEKVDEFAKDSESVAKAEENIDGITNATDTVVDHVKEGFEEKNTVDAIEETVSDVVDSEEKVEEIIVATNAMENEILDNKEVPEKQAENLVDVTNAEINQVLEESESYRVHIVDTPKEFTDDNTKAKNESEEVADKNTITEKVDNTENITEKTYCVEVATNEIHIKDEVDTGSESTVLNNGNEAVEVSSTTKDSANDNQNKDEIDTDSAHKNNSADGIMPEDVKSSPNVIENRNSHVTKENFSDADSVPVEKVPDLEKNYDKNINIDKIPESLNENISKENAVADNHDNDRDTLLESPTLENIKSVIKSEISLEDANNESSEHNRFKRDLENISEAQEISESVQPGTETISIKKSNSLDSTISNSNDSNLELDTVKSSDESTQGNTQSHSNMDLETAAVTIQKVFRTFMFKSRGSTFDDTGNEESNLTDEENDKEEVDFSAAPKNLNKERRTLGIHRMDTVLQTVNEEKSLSLSTDDSSTLSSAATVIQAHVRGFLVRNRLNSNKTTSSNSLVNSDGPSTTSFEADNDQHKANKTVLNIHIVPGDQYLSRDESMITSMELSLDGSPPSSTNLHPLGYDKSEPRKQLKREDAIQSVSPPSNNSGKLSEDVDSTKEVLTNDGASPEQKANESTLINELQHDTDTDTRGTALTERTTIETVVETLKCTSDESGSPEPEEKLSELQEKRKRSLTKMSSDECDVVTPFLSEDKGVPSDSGKEGLLHSGEFHDVVLPTKVSRSDTSVVREFKNVLVYFLLLNNS